MERIVVLGGGLVGSAITRDLTDSFDGTVTLIDRDGAALGRVRDKCGCAVIEADLGDPETIGRLVEEHDLVVNALPGFLGKRALRAIIEAGRPVVDISFMPEDPRDMDALARDKGVTVVYDCGVAPGLSHLLAGRIVEDLDETERLRILVGGLPVERRWPFEYGAVFSPVDVLEEYTRPARCVEHGKVVEKEAMSDPERITARGVGTLEATTTDGLRSLIDTLPVPHMVEKTLRYPGHFELMRVFRETGFFSEAPLEVKGVTVRPVDVTAALLFPKWHLGPDDEELTYMTVTGEGTVDGAPARRHYELLDKTDPTHHETSMARTTGFVATAVARMIARGDLHLPGVQPPEILGKDQAVLSSILRDLAERGIEITEQHG